MSWLKKLRGNNDEPVQTAVPYPPPAPPPPTASTVSTWDETRRVAALICGNDQQVNSWLNQAETDWDAFEAAANASSRNLGSDLIDYEGDPVGTLRALLIDEQHLGYLDWKEAGAAVLDEFSRVLERAGMPKLTEAQEAAMLTIEPIDSNQDCLFFMDLAGPLDAHLDGTGKRLLGVDEDSDAYSFAIVDAEAWKQLVGTSLGSGPSSTPGMLRYNFYDVTTFR